MLKLKGTGRQAVADAEVRGRVPHQADLKQRELMRFEYPGQQCFMAIIQEPAVSARRIQPSLVDQTAQRTCATGRAAHRSRDDRRTRVSPESEGSLTCDVVLARAETFVSSYLCKPWTGEVNKEQIAHRFESRQRSQN